MTTPSYEHRAPNEMLPIDGDSAAPQAPESVPHLTPEQLAVMTPEEKDRWWFRNVYQGDRMPQLTWRAVLMGGVLGMAMSAANLYTTLSIGWAFGIAITSCVLSFVIWNFVRFCSGKHLSQMSVLENACMASTASAAGYSTGSTIATMFGALVLLHDIPEGMTAADVKTWDVTAPWVVVVFTLCTGLMGVFLAIPMKRQQINHEQLPFPSGIAAAETLKSLYSASAEAVHKAYMLVFGLALGLLIGFLRVGDDVLGAVGFLKRLFERIPFLRIPTEVELNVINRLYPGSRHAAGFAFEPSALLIAAGMIVGMRISLSLLISSLVLYGIVGPRLAAVDASHMERAAVAMMTSATEAGQNATTPDAAGKAAVAAVVNSAESLGLDVESIRTAATTASRDAVDAAEREAGESIIESVVVAAERLGLSSRPIRAASGKAAASTKVHPGAAGAAAALEAATQEATQRGVDPSSILAASIAAAKKNSIGEAKAAAAVAKRIGATLAPIAATSYANLGASKAREEARSRALASGATTEEVESAGNAAFERNKFKPNFIWNWGGGVITITRWSLWGGTAVMVFSSLMSVALQWRTLVRAFMGVKSAAKEGEEHDARLREIEVPGSWMIVGMLPITIAMVWLQIQAFDVSWYAGLIAVAMSFVLSLVASRATGETDTTPIGAMGKVMQLMFAVLAPKNIAANLASAGIAANSASSSADLLTDLKTGYLLGANPRKQFLAQFFGVFFGTLAIVPIWYLMVPTRAKLESFALPSTRAWEAVARVLVKGVGELPPSAVWAIFIGAGIGVVLPVIEKLLPASKRKYMPSATGIGLAWVMPFQNAFSFFIGAVIALFWVKVHNKSAEKFNVPLASGLIAGESLMAAALAITATVVGLIASSGG